jgi:hypothetical protein
MALVPCSGKIERESSDLWWISMDFSRSRPDTAERIESLKAGVTGAIAAGITVLLLWNVDRLTAGLLSTGLASAASESVIGVNGAIQGASGLLSGFLFGVTYRYILRHDDNPQLSAGAVMAFGLVRGLSQVERADLPWTASHWTGSLWLAGSWLGQSILLFGVAAFVLDRAMLQQWIKPFGATSE